MIIHNTTSKPQAFQAKLQRGMSMIEMAAWTLLAGIVAAIVLSSLGVLKGGINAGNLGEKALYLAMDIQKHWNRANDYTSVTAAEVDKIGIVKNPIKFDSGQLYDGYGNQMALNGSRITFAMTLGGTAAPMDKDDCANLVARLEPVAMAIRVGASAAANAGVISGGNLYKNGATLDQTGLTTGCAEAGTKIAIQVR